MKIRVPSIYLAPFQGITTASYRSVYANHFKGVEKIFTPFFTAIHKQKSLSSKAAEIAVTHIRGVKIIPQILSKDADEMLRFADYCHEKSQDEINWNLGCPYPRVANKKRGSGMLMFPDMVYQILEKVISESPIKWSIKCRLGYLSADEIKALAPIFNEFDISELIIHARLGKQLYKGEVDLDNFHEALSLIKAPIAYNGDIFTTTDFQKLQNRFPITRWMIGRGLLVDPFLPAAIMGSVLPTLDDQQFAIRKFVEDLYLTYRKQMNDRPQAISVMKELWGFMAYGFNKPQKIFNTIKKCNSFESYETAVSKAFSDFQWLGSDADLYRAKLAKEE